MAIDQAQAPNQDDEQRSLQALDTDPDLHELDKTLRGFNIFEATGFITQELRHSNFLAFLLDPRQSHGLGDSFARRFLCSIIEAAEDDFTPVTVAEVENWTLDDLTVKREWHHTDIFLLHEMHRLAIVIENKTDSREGEGQLKAYRCDVEEHYPQSAGWRNIYVFLTPPNRQPPTDLNYTHIQYDMICKVIEEITRSSSMKMGTDVKVLLTHYVELLRRYLVDDKIAALCGQIYQKHQRAIDLILQHRADQISTVRDLLIVLVQKTSSLSLDDYTKNYIRFGVKEWDVSTLLVGTGWTSSKRILLFVFNNWINSLTLALYIGPGDETTREQLCRMAVSNSLFRKEKEGKWFKIYSHVFLTANDYLEADNGTLKQKIDEKWQKFLENDFEAIRSTVRAQEWIWKS